MINYENLNTKTIRVVNKFGKTYEMSMEEIDKMIIATKEEMSFWKNGIDDEGFNYNNYLANLLNLKSEYRDKQINKILED